MTETSTPEIVYCGCWERVGHFTWLPSGRRRPLEAPGDGIGPWKHLDTKSLWPYGQRQGKAMVTHEGGWTALRIADNTVDKRGGSHSTFAIEGIHDFDQALALAREHFPQIVARLEAAASITLVGVEAR